MKLYLETTMFNYYFDAERDGHADTVKLFEAIGRGEYDGYTSEYVTLELQRAPEPKRSDMLALARKYGITVLDFEDEAVRLANLYVENRIIPSKYLLDGTHIAIASIHNLDCILSFNFQHINKLKTKEMTALVNLREGYKGIIICTPMEVLEDEETE
jgi:predicted nucleic acid-binding protein